MFLPLFGELIIKSVIYGFILCARLTEKNTTHYLTQSKSASFLFTLSFSSVLLPEADKVSRV